MVFTRAGNGNDGASGSRDEVREEMRNLFQGFMDAAMHTMAGTAPRAQAPPERFGLPQFLKLNPIKYNGEPDVQKAELWIEAMQKIFVVFRCAEEDKVRFAAYMLTGTAEHWWTATMTSWDATHVPYTWELFARKFKEKFIPRADKNRREMEFIHLEQSAMTVSQYEAKFTELARYCGYLIPDEERKAAKFIKGLRTSIRSHLISQDIQEYQKAVDRASLVEQDIGENKKKAELLNSGRLSGPSRSQQPQKFNNRGGSGAPAQFRGQTHGQLQLQPQPITRQRGTVQGATTGKLCTYCQKGGHTEDRCWRKQGKCLNCGQMGHFANTCPKPRQPYGNVSGPPQGQKRDATGNPKVPGRVFAINQQQAVDAPNVIGVPGESADRTL